MKERILLELISCDLCGCSTYKTRYRKPDNWLWINQYEFPVVECVNCGLVYLNPRPTQESMSKFYPSDYHVDRNTEEFQMRYKAELEYLPKLTNETILDIGCARGDFLNYTKQRYPNIKVFGIDFFSQKVDYDFIQFTQKSLPDAKFPQFYFDIITAWAVFEHIHDPSNYFGEVYRILKKGGRFIFLVTNSESYYGKYAYIEDIPRHTYHFSEGTLTKYAKKFGFEVCKVKYETRFWNATGHGTFYYKFMEIMGSNWEKRYLHKDNYIQRFGGRVGSIVDKVVFKWHWEAKFKKSGIIVAEFIKL